MRGTDDRSALVGVGALLGLGWVLVALNTVRALRSDASIYSQLIGVAIPFALAVVLFAGAIGITVYGLLDRAWLIAKWTILGTVTVTTAIVLNVVAFESVRPDFLLALYMIVNAAGGGAAFGFLIGLYDAHQQRLRRDWKHETEKASALSQRLSVINRVLRHDIRNQAQIISGFMEQWDAQTPDQADQLDSVLRASDRLTKISNEARDLQALLDGADLGTEALDVAATARAAGEDVQADHPELTIEYDLPDECVLGTTPYLKRALTQLLTNAVEHNDSPTPEATVTLAETESTIRLAVRDNGPGIPAHEPLPDDGFEETQLRHSNGVGLWLVKWLIEDADGEVEFETPADGGTLVTLHLPKQGR